MGASLGGILALNALFLVAGVAILAGIRGFASVVDLLELLGLALILGLCSVGVLATLVLVAGGGLPTGTIVGLAGGIIATGIALAVVNGRRSPRTLGRLPRPTPGNLVAAACAVAALAVLLALFRVARVTQLEGADSWEFWVPKAQVIYFKGGIGDPLFTTFAGPNYPLLVPALMAMDFRFMGSANAPELAVQLWIVYAAFVLAAGALLRRLVRPWLGWLFVALTAVIPALDTRVIDSEGDWTLDILFALCAILAIGWLRTRERWQLWSFGIVLAAVLATKREGELLAACLALGLVASSTRSWRRVLPAVVGVSIAAYAVNFPWRLWWRSRHLQSDLPGGGLHLHDLATHLGSIWPSFLEVVHPLFDTSLWLVFVPLALVASLACLTVPGPGRDASVLYLTTLALGVAGFTWVAWSDPAGMVGSQNPLPRLVGSLVLLSTVLTPLVVEPLLERRRDVAPLPQERSRPVAVTVPPSP